jgi:hypothetical protein
MDMGIAKAHKVEKRAQKCLSENYFLAALVAIVESSRGGKRVKNIKSVVNMHAMELFSGDFISQRTKRKSIALVHSKCWAGVVGGLATTRSRVRTK